METFGYKVGDIVGFYDNTSRNPMAIIIFEIGSFKESLNVITNKMRTLAVPVPGSCAKYMALPDGEELCDGCSLYTSWCPSTRLLMEVHPRIMALYNTSSLI